MAYFIKFRAYQWYIQYVSWDTLMYQEVIARQSILPVKYSQVLARFTKAGNNQSFWKAMYSLNPKKQTAPLLTP